MERIIYAHAIYNAKNDAFTLYLPREAARALELEDRDELKLIAIKTGRKIQKKVRFKKKQEISNENP